MKLKAEKRIFTFNLEVELIEKFKELYPNASKKLNEILQNHLNENNIVRDSLIITNLKRELGEVNIQIDDMIKTQKEWNTLLPTLQNKKAFIAKEIGRLKKDEEKRVIKCH